MNRFFNFVQSLIRPDTISTIVNVATGAAKPADLIKTFLASGTPELILSQAIESLNQNGALAPYADKISRITEMLFAELIVLSAPPESPLASVARAAIVAWSTGDTTPKAWSDYIASLKAAFASVTQTANDAEAKQE